MNRTSLVLLVTAAAGCRAAQPGDDQRDAAAEVEPSPRRPAPGPAAPPHEDWSHDVRATTLAVDVEAQTATASIELGPSSSTAASFEIGDLEILAVRGPAGPLRFADVGARLDVALPPSDDPLTLDIDYRFAWHGDRTGAMESGSTLVWPYNCGNLFPCRSDPADGLRLGLKLTGVDPDLTAVYPTSMTSDAPSYQLAWAIADYERLDLGETRDGTHVSVWYLPASETAARAGTASLRAAFDWLEQTYGRYAFGAEVGSVEASSLGYAGMEHHPYWHLDSSAMADFEVHVHEAAHGWFGAGVRIACWEDLVLSEGTTTYLTTRAIEAVDGPAAGERSWAEHRQLLVGEPGPELARNVWPEGCNRHDVLDFYSGLVYVKGAFFYRALERRIGRERLDAALAAAYARHRGEAATMQDMLDVIEASSGYDPDACAAAWLRAAELPDIDAPCP